MSEIRKMTGQVKAKGKKSLQPRLIKSGIITVEPLSYGPLRYGHLPQLGS